MKHAIILLILFLSGCALNHDVATDKIQVVATISPLKEFAEAVGGEFIETNQLLPAGADPHSWDPRPTDLQKISNADMFLFIGSGLEPWVENLPDLEDTVLVEAGKIVQLIETPEDSGHGHEGSDPHLWLDVDNDIIIIDALTSELIKRSPENKEIFLQNSKDYKDKLQAMDKKYVQGLKDCKFDTFIVGGHSAFSYLAKRYGLEQIAVSGLSPDAEPSAQRIAEIIDIFDETGIKYIIFERTTSPKVAEVIGAETGAQTLELDTGVATDKSFLDIMDSDLKTLKIALVCR